LASSNRIENLLRRDADIAVRMQRPEQDVLVARRIGNIELGFHAHRDYVQRNGMPRTWQELAQHALIGIDRESARTRSIMPLLAHWKAVTTPSAATATWFTSRRSVRDSASASARCGWPSAIRHW
jgi:DNA-binding transcriptional LysR family regulator